MNPGKIIRGFEKMKSIFLHHIRGVYTFALSLFLYFSLAPASVFSSDEIQDNTEYLILAHSDLREKGMKEYETSLVEKDDNVRSQQNFVQGREADEIFRRKFEDAEDAFRKKELFNAYILYLIAYDYATSRDDRFKVKMRLGDILMKWGDTSAAEEVYMDALKLKPRSFQALKKLVIAKAENMSNDFLTYLKKIPSDKVDSEILYFWGKYVLRAKKNPRKACDLFDSVRKESPYFFDASYLCGVAMIMIGDREEALRRFKFSEMSENKLLREFSSLAIARILTDIGKFEEAMPYYLKIPNDSPAFYEAKYEVCWVLYALRKYEESEKCARYFKTLQKTYFTRRIEVLEAFLNMRRDLVGAFLSFTALSDYSSMLVSLIIELEKMPLSFWRENYVKYLGAKEPNIKNWVEYFPEYKQFIKRQRYIQNLQKDINRTLADLERIRNTAVIIADKAVRKYFERLWIIQRQIQDIVSKITFNFTTNEEKNTWFTLYTLSEELRNLDMKARELVAIASVRINDITREREFKNWEKKYRAYVSVMGKLFKQIDVIGSYYRRNANYVVKMANLLAKDGKDGLLIPEKDRIYLQSLINTYRESELLFFEFSALWRDIISSVNKYLMAQEKKLRAVSSVLNNFLDYLDDYQTFLVKYLVTVKIKQELMKTFALAQYGFIESAWVMKEMESSTLDKLHMIRLEEERKVRDKFSQIYDNVDKVKISPPDVSAKSSLELELSQAYQLADEINRRISEAMRSVGQAMGIRWNPPDKTVQELFEERRKKIEQLEKLKREKQK